METGRPDDSGAGACEAEVEGLRTVGGGGSGASTAGMLCTLAASDAWSGLVESDTPLLEVGGLEASFTCSPAILTLSTTPVSR